MAERGWRLEEYLDDLGSALFHPTPERAALSPWHPRRLLPQPGTFDVRTRLQVLLGAGPERLILGGAAATVAVVLFFTLVLGVFNSAPRTAAPTVEVWLFVTANSLNVRELPNGDAQIVGVLYLNQRVLVGDEQFGWIQVHKPERGYVARQFLAELPAR